MPSYGGQGPSMSALAQQNQQHPPFGPPPVQKQIQLFVGSISAGVSDEFMTQLLSACGPLRSFKRLITPANKPQGFGFAEFEDPESALVAIKLLNGVELPALEESCANKKLLIKADEKTKLTLDIFASQRMATDNDEKSTSAQSLIASHLEAILALSQSAASSSADANNKFIIPPHLHDLQEADLPPAQRGLVISEIAQFRERAAMKEREKQKDVMRESFAQASKMMTTSPGPGGQVPNGPKGGVARREWGRPQGQAQQGFGDDAQGYNKPVDFVPQANGNVNGAAPRTDEEMETERREARRREEEVSYRDRERRYEPRERQRITALERALTRERATKEAEERDRTEIGARLDVWDDDESDEMFYVDRPRWRALRARRLTTEISLDAQSRSAEATETDTLRRESEAFLERQMGEMAQLAEEQRKAGLLLDDGAPVRLNVSVALPAPGDGGGAGKTTVFGAEDDEDDDGSGTGRRRRGGLVKLDFSVEESAEKTKERLERIREGVPGKSKEEKEELFKARVRWDGVSDTLIDRKLEPLVKRLMTRYLGEMEEDDLILFTLEHMKDHKGPKGLVEGLEPVLEEDATELVIALWRQVIFESMAYGEGLLTDRMMVDD